MADCRAGLGFNLPDATFPSTYPSDALPYWLEQILQVGGQVVGDVFGPSSTYGYPTYPTYTPPYTAPYSGSPSGSYYTMPGVGSVSSGMLLLGGAVLLLLLLRRR